MDGQLLPYALRHLTYNLFFCALIAIQAINPMPVSRDFSSILKVEV
jgi:hypothetical protein